MRFHRNKDTDILLICVAGMAAKACKCNLLLSEHISHNYVRPLLEYASSVWSPHLLKDIKRVESVQRRFTTRLPGMGDKNYSRRLTDIGLESLELRRLQQDLVLTYKILFSKLVVNYENMFNVRLHSRTRGHDWKLMTSHSHTDIRKHFYRIRVLAGGIVLI